MSLCLSKWSSFELIRVKVDLGEVNLERGVPGVVGSEGELSSVKNLGKFMNGSSWPATHCCFGEDKLLMDDLPAGRVFPLAS